MEKAFDPSMRAAAFEGPKQGMPTIYIHNARSIVQHDLVFFLNDVSLFLGGEEGELKSPTSGKEPLDTIDEGSLWSRNN